ncbi:MAG: ABC transporter substrate-binding protein, partial [Acidobacteria bacterium]|nr:ABC transporter substrate-binding protein [Acidobacteriota bacterium]
IALLGFNACRQATPPPDMSARRNVTDELNRTVAINANPQRIISLAPNLTEMLFALGLGDRVIGVTSYCDYPPAAKTKEKVGDTLTPNLERIIALKPDLVIVTTSSQLEKITRQLDQLQIPVYVTNPRSVNEVLASLQHLGDVTGATAQAAKLHDELQTRINAVTARVAAQPKPKALFLVQDTPLLVAGSDTFLHDLVTLAGGESITVDVKGYPQFSREIAIARAPEVIIDPGRPENKALADSVLRKDYATTPAIKQNRIIHIDPDLTNRPGPRLIEGLEQLAHALHPTAFAAQP